MSVGEGVRHVVVGGGHFVNQGGQVFQQFGNNVRVGERALGQLDRAFGAIENCFDWTKKYSQGIATPINNPYRVDDVVLESVKLDLSPAWDTIVNRSSATNTPKGFDYTFCGNDLDSRAWEDRNNFMDKAREGWNNFTDSHAGKAAKEGALMGGCAAAGDFQGALEHGVECLKELWENEKGLWQRPGDGK